MLGGPVLLPRAMGDGGGTGLGEAPLSARSSGPPRLLLLWHLLTRPFFVTAIRIGPLSTERKLLLPAFSPKVTEVLLWNL